MTKTVLVTGIGGNVGQGILRNIISCKYDVKLVGTNTEIVSGGNHLCDVVYKVPFSTSPRYISTMQKICTKEHVDLVVPSTDYETYYLALAREKLPSVATSDAKVCYTFLNKYETWKIFSKFSIPFAKTTLPSLYKDEFKGIVVKPIEGRGSRDIHINPDDPRAFSDDFIIQKLYKGKELTTAFYVTKKRELLGHITFIRSLSHGTTDRCEVVFDYKKEVEKIIRKMIDSFEIKGSCNIQAIVSKGGRVIPFEINGRISGTNSIRGQFGFEDVRYTLQEYLFNEDPEKPVIKRELRLGY